MKNMLHIFVLTAFLGGIIAPACGFSWGGQFSVIEICTAQGIESKIVENDQNSEDKTPHQTANDCQFCFASANLNSILPNSTKFEAIIFKADKKRFDTYETIVLSKIKDNLSARGPPTFV